MKKVVLLILVVILCLSLVACGEKKEPKNEVNETPVVEDTSKVEEPEVIVVPEVTEESNEVSGEDISGENIMEETTEEVSGEVER